MGIPFVQFKDIVINKCTALPEQVLFQLVRCESDIERWKNQCDHWTANDESRSSLLLKTKFVDFPFQKFLWLKLVPWTHVSERRNPLRLKIPCSCGSTETDFGHARPSRINFLHFHAVFMEVWLNNRLVPTPSGWRALLRNPGSGSWKI